MILIIIMLALGLLITLTLTGKDPTLEGTEYENIQFEIELIKEQYMSEQKIVFEVVNGRHETDFIEVITNEDDTISLPIFGLTYKGQEDKQPFQSFKAFSPIEGQSVTMQFADNIETLLRGLSKYKHGDLVLISNVKKLVGVVENKAEKIVVNLSQIHMLTNERYR